MTKKLKRWVDLQSPNGYKRSQVQHFNDDKHESNWIEAMTRKGYKIIGVNNIEE